jgi:phosphoserine phosphatase
MQAVSHQLPTRYASSRHSFNPEVRAQLDQLFADVRAGKIEDPVAVFDADGTCWEKDCGEGFYRWQVANQAAPGLDYSRDLIADYKDHYMRDRTGALVSTATCMAGLPESTVKAQCASFMKGFARNIYPAQQQLIADMQRAGMKVYIVSASQRWIVEAGAAHLGVSPDHVRGIQTAVVDGKLTDHVIGHITYRQGKADAILDAIGHAPCFVAGNAMTDYEMLQMATHTALVINPHDTPPPENNLYEHALKNHWHIQVWPDTPEQPPVQS